MMYETESIMTIFCAAVILAVMIGAYHTDLGKTPRHHVCFFVFALITAIVGAYASFIRNEYACALSYIIASFAGASWAICCVKEDNRAHSRILYIFSIAASIICIYGTTVDDVDISTIVYAIIAAIPAIFVIVLSIDIAVKNRSYSKRIEALRMICFSLPLIAGFLLQIAYHGEITLLVLGLAITTLLLYIWFQVIRITTDEGTTLYNRYKLENYLEKWFEVCKNDPEKQMCIGFGDMDSFGRVRREHGVDVAKECIGKIGRGIKELSSPDFLPCIYGGDEFVFVTIGNKDKMEEYREKIYSLIADIDKDYPFMLHMSIGFVELTDQDTYDDMIAQADEVQAEVKEKFYTESGITRHKWGKK